MTSRISPPSFDALLIYPIRGILKSPPHLYPVYTSGTPLFYPPLLPLRQQFGDLRLFRPNHGAYDPPNRGTRFRRAFQNSRVSVSCLYRNQAAFPWTLQIFFLDVSLFPIFSYQFFSPRQDPPICRPPHKVTLTKFPGFALILRFIHPVSRPSLAGGRYRSRRLFFLGVHHHGSKPTSLCACRA